MLISKDIERVPLLSHCGALGQFDVGLYVVNKGADGVISSQGGKAEKPENTGSVL